MIEHSSGVRLPGVRCHAAIHSPRSSASPIVKREQCNGGTDASVAARVCRDSAGSRPVTVPGSQHKRDMNGSSRCHNGLNLDLGFQGHLLEGAVCSQPKNGVKVEGTTRRKALRQEGGQCLEALRPCGERGVGGGGAGPRPRETHVFLLRAEGIKSEDHGPLFCQRIKHLTYGRHSFLVGEERPGKEGHWLIGYLEPEGS